MAKVEFLGSRFDACAVLHWLEARRWKVLAFTLPTILLLHYVVAGETINHSNLQWWPSDQLAEVYLAGAARRDALPMRTDGVRHPLWSWTAAHLAGHLYSDSIDDKTAIFTRGKWINTTICLFFLAALGLSVARWLDPLATVNLLLLCSFGILIVRGTYFQPEPLYYIFFFLAGILACRVLSGGKLWHYFLLGVLCGLAYLAKPSLLPFLLTLGVAFAVRVALAMLRRGGDWPLKKNLTGIALAGLVFCLLLIPLGRYTTEAFGQPFFSYTKYWMWMDSFKTEAYPFQTSHPTRESLESIPPDEIPSLGWYFRRHTLSDAIKRGVQGVSEVVPDFLFPEPKLAGREFFWRLTETKWRQPLAHRGVYVVALGALCIGLLWPLRRAVLAQSRETGNLVCVGFLALSFAFYVALYGWYYPVGRGDRFMGSLWIPVIFLLCWGAFSLRRQSGAAWSGLAYFAVHAAILVMLLVQIANIFWRFGRGWYLETQN